MASSVRADMDSFSSSFSNVNFLLVLPKRHTHNALGKYFRFYYSGPPQTVKEGRASFYF